MIDAIKAKLKEDLETIDGFLLFESDRAFLESRVKALEIAIDYFDNLSTAKECPILIRVYVREVITKIARELGVKG